MLSRPGSKNFLAVVTFVLLLVTLWLATLRLGIVASAGGDRASFIASFAMLFAPYWAFGFGAAPYLRHTLRTRTQRLLAPLLLFASYLVFVLPRDEFTWSMGAALLIVPVGLTALFEYAPVAQPERLHWQDAVALSIIGVLVSFRLLGAAWPHPGLGGLPKLLLVDLALYLYLVVRPLPNIGYDFRPKWRDWAIGLREFIFFAPIVIGLGFAIGFLTWHPHATVLSFVIGWLLIFFFTAIPEELYFRGLIQNGLQNMLGSRSALFVTSAIFGLSHFNKGAAFNWRYVLLATIAGIFYGRAWKDRNRLFCSAITHATVDAVWGLWFR
jgi:hypothetical protein